MINRRFQRIADVSFGEVFRQIHFPSAQITFRILLQEKLGDSIQPSGSSVWSFLSVSVSTARHELSSKLVALKGGSPRGFALLILEMMTLIVEVSNIADINSEIKNTKSFDYLPSPIALANCKPARSFLICSKISLASLVGTTHNVRYVSNKAHQIECAVGLKVAVVLDLSVYLGAMSQRLSCPD